MVRGVGECYCAPMQVFFGRTPRRVVPATAPAMATLMAAVVASATMACGGAPKQPREAVWDEVDVPVGLVTPDGNASASATEPVAATSADTSAPRSCYVDFAQLARAGAEFSYRLPPAAEAWLRVRTDAVDSEGRLSVVYEQRNEDGSRRGENLFACEPAGLTLVCATDTDGRLCFDPPVMVLPWERTGGAGAGTATLTQGEEEQTFSYSFAYDAADEEPWGALQTERGRWRSVRSVLVLEQNGGEYEWAAETTWLVRPSALGAIRRRVEVRDPNGGLRIIDEEARVISGR